MSKQNNNKKLVKIVTILWHWDQSHYLDELWSLLIKMFSVLDVIFFFNRKYFVSFYPLRAFYYFVQLKLQGTMP